MPVFAAEPGLALRYWDGETTGVVRRSKAGSTHLVDLEGLAVLQALIGHPSGLPLREIAHALDLGDAAEPEVEAALQSIIDGLVQAGLLRRVDDDSPGPGSQSTP